MLQQNFLCFPCLEKVKTKFPIFPVFPVPWPPRGSVSSVMERLTIKLAFRTSFWLITMLFLLTVLTVQNGSFVRTARRHTTFNVSPLSQSNRSMPKDGHSPAHSMNVKEKQIKQINPPTTNPRSINWVTKRVTIFGLAIDFYSMKQKFSKKGKGSKVLKTPEEQKKASSHAGQKLQKWKEEDMKEAERLWARNDTLPPKERLSMRAIAAKVRIGKTTVIERLSGRCKGEGHIGSG